MDLYSNRTESDEPLIRRMYKGALGQGKQLASGGFKMNSPVMIGVLAVSALIGYSTLRNTVGQTEVGVKINKITGSCEALTAGTYHFAPIINDWYKLSTQVDTVSMTEKKVGEKTFDNRLSFKTKDGNEIKLSIEFPYQVNPAKACEVIENVGQSNEEIRDKIVRTYDRRAARDEFGELSSQHFTNAAERNKQSSSIKKHLEDKLGQYGIMVRDVNTGTITFDNEKYRQLVKNMTIAAQTIPTIKSSREAQVSENAKLFNVAEGYVKEMTASVDGQLKQEKAKADGYFQQKKNEAVGILAQGQNRAAAIVKERESMMSGGGITQIQMQVAKCLQGKEIVPVPMCSNGQGQISVFDMNKFLTQLNTAKQAAKE